MFCETVQLLAWKEAGSDPMLVLVNQKHSTSGG